VSTVARLSADVVGAPHKSGGGVGKSGAGELRLELALRFGELCKENFFRRNPAELPDEAEFGESPDHPLCGIDLPWLHSRCGSRTETRDDSYGSPRRR